MISSNRLFRFFLLLVVSTAIPVLAQEIKVTDVFGYFYLNVHPKHSSLA